jgi:hypothetical protein
MKQFWIRECHARHVTIFETSRRFEVVTWGPGHRGLLLRSRPTEVVVPDVPFDRIEVWFKPADVVCLPVHLDGLVVDDADRETQAAIAQVLGRDLDPWQNAYVVGTALGRPAGWSAAASTAARISRPLMPRRCLTAGRRVLGSPSSSHTRAANRAVIAPTGVFRDTALFPS